MAKIVSPCWSSARGSIAGTTYLTTPAGAIIARQRVRPTQRVTQYTIYAREALSVASNRWSSIVSKDPGLLLGWESAAATTPLSPRNLFIATWSQAALLQSYGAGRPPSTQYPPYAEGEVVTVEPTTYTGPPGTTGIALFCVAPYMHEEGSFIGLCSISPGFGYGRRSWRGPWLSALTEVITCPSQEEATVSWSGLIQNLWYFVRVRGLCHLEPLVGPPSWIRTNMLTQYGEQTTPQLIFRVQAKKVMVP